jgi:hypothetical protein
MKKSLTIWIILVALLCALVPIALHRTMAKPAPAPFASHPEYQEAVEALRNARKHLAKADSDGYGHRDNAMRAIDNALDECQQAVQALR